MPKKLIIDTDPGVDDAFALFMAFASDEVEVIGLTTIYGNVRTPRATQNALHLCEMAGRADVPVAQGACGPLRGGEKERIADFVHGQDGLGNTGHYKPARRAADPRPAAQFIVDMANTYPGEVTVLALASLTNIALAFMLDPTCAGKLKQLVILGGAFFVNGNVNPAAEANIFGDPEAADAVFASAADMLVVGLDVTHQATLTATELTELRDGGGKIGRYCHEIAQFYLAYHVGAYGMQAIYLHDPSAMAAVLAPTLFTWNRGAIRVVLDGPAKGHTIMDAGTKTWNSDTPWTGRPQIAVATAVDAPGVVRIVKERLQRA